MISKNKKKINVLKKNKKKIATKFGEERRIKMEMWNTKISAAAKIYRERRLRRRWELFCLFCSVSAFYKTLYYMYIIKYIIFWKVRLEENRTSGILRNGSSNSSILLFKFFWATSEYANIKAAELWHSPWQPLERSSATLNLQ